MQELVTIEGFKKSFTLGLTETERLKLVEKFIKKLLPTDRGISDIMEAQAFEVNAAFHRDRNSRYYQKLNELREYQINSLYKNKEKPKKKKEYFEEAKTEFLDALYFAISDSEV